MFLKGKIVFGSVQIGMVGISLILVNYGIPYTHSPIEGVV